MNQYKRENGLGPHKPYQTRSRDRQFLEWFRLHLKFHSRHFRCLSRFFLRKSGVYWSNYVTKHKGRQWPPSTINHTHSLNHFTYTDSRRFWKVHRYLGPPRSQASRVDLPESSPIHLPQAPSAVGNSVADASTT